MADLGLRPEVLNPLTPVRLYITVIIPILLYGCELWNNMSRTDSIKLSQLRHFITKKIQGFHIRARSDMVESMLGLNRITALVDKRKLMFLFKILNLDNSSICQQIFLRKLFHYLYSLVKSKHGFIPDICSILIKNNLNFLLNMYVNDKGYLPQKRVWWQFVHSSVNFVENNEFLDRLKAADFSRFSQLHKSISPCSLYSLYGRGIAPHKLAFLAKLWVTVPSHTAVVCNLCNRLVQDEIKHKLVECAFIGGIKGHLFSCLYSKLSYDSFSELVLAPNDKFVILVLGANSSLGMSNEEASWFRMKAVYYVYQCFHGPYIQ